MRPPHSVPRHTRTPDQHAGIARATPVSVCLRSCAYLADWRSLTACCLHVPTRHLHLASRALETIQEAEAALHEAMHPNRRGEGEEGADGVEGGSGDGGDGGVLTEESKGDLAAEADGDAGVELTRADLPRLEEALDGVKRVGGDIRLIAAGTALRARLKAQMRLEDEVAALDKRRPLTRRTDVSELVAATRAAEEVGVDAKLVEQASTLAELALAECKLRGMITVCGNIALATHDHDGDMARLQEAFGICSRLGAGAELVAEGDALFKKLRTEVRGLRWN